MTRYVPPLLDVDVSEADIEAARLVGASGTELVARSIHAALDRHGVPREGRDVTVTPERIEIVLPPRLGVRRLDGAPMSPAHRVRKALSDAWYGNLPDLPLFSDVAINGRCPTCGGWQFTAKRSMNDKLWYGAFALPLIIFAPKTIVRCETCGAAFRKG